MQIGLNFYILIVTNLVSWNQFCGPIYPMFDFFNPNLVLHQILVLWYHAKDFGGKIWHPNMGSYVYF